MKIAVLFNQFGPYHYARLNALGKISDLYGVEFFSKSNTYKWNSSNFKEDISFVKETLFKLDDPLSISKRVLANKIYQTLDTIDPDIVAINGWSESGAFVALKWCLLRKKHAIAMSESTEFDAERSKIKEAIKKQIVRKFSAAIVGGTPHKKYINQLGLPYNCIFEKYDVVDNNYFLSLARSIREKDALYRKKLNLPENYFLASARFVPKKNLKRLIEGYSAYLLKQKTDSWNLVLLGDGELQPMLIDLVEKLDLKEKVIMPGFKQYNELPYYYALAKAFIHSSTSEQWGLVVNEAMASGLPILISDRCGCAYDLIKAKVNGLIFNPYSVEDIEHKMTLFSSGHYDLTSMSSQSLDIISRYTPTDFADNLLLAAEKALTTRKKSITLMNRVVLNFLIQK